MNCLRPFFLGGECHADASHAFVGGGEGDDGGQGGHEQREEERVVVVATRTRSCMTPPPYPHGLPPQPGTDISANTNSFADMC